MPPRLPPGMDLFVQAQGFAPGAWPKFYRAAQVKKKVPDTLLGVESDAGQLFPGSRGEAAISVSEHMMRRVKQACSDGNRIGLPS
jgi:hypothetical protein